MLVCIESIKFLSKYANLNLFISDVRLQGFDLYLKLLNLYSFLVGERLKLFE